MSDSEALPLTTPTLTHNPQTHTLALLPLATPNLSSPSAPSNPDSSTTPTHLLLIHATALTNGELAWPEPATASPPVPGYDIAATVLAAPPASPFPAGTPVFARTAFSRQGNARRYGVAAAAELARAPADLPPALAATVPLSALTAWQALFVHAGLAVPPAGAGGGAESCGRGRGPNSGKSVLVTAAAGGVGLWLVQLARWAGVGRVVGTCGRGNVEFVRGLGAHEVLDYGVVRDLGARDWEAEGGKFDLVVDGVGEDTLAQAWRCAKAGGLVICTAMPAELKKPETGVEERVRSLWFIVEADRGQLDRVTGLLEAGEVKAVLDSTFRLEEYEKAFEKVHSGHVRGKVVLTMD